jgi:retron-type reverse transcriptase
MKRYGNLYAKVHDFSNLLRAARQAEKGKRFRPSCSRFNLDLEKNLFALRHELRDKVYRPGLYHHFKIYEPKERLISAAPYRDRVVHHALVNVIEPIFDAPMIYDSYANRINKGTHKAAGWSSSVPWGSCARAGFSKQTEKVAPPAVTWSPSCRICEVTRAWLT